ncbi:MAG: response regulator [Alphaproteobacteria bacterium]|nr:response regulator [Alphaproteobacteria bacterium]
MFQAEDYRRIRVLIVEDQAFVRQLLKGLLRKMGFDEIEETKDGTEGWAALRRRPPDLILCDIQMKPMGGLEMLNLLRNSGEARLAGIPFIFLTSQDDASTVEAALGSGVDGYLLKPVSHQALQARIDAALKAVAARG